jgi:hypothetical protein
VGSLREIRKGASSKDIPESFRPFLKSHGIFRMISRVKIETERSWGEDLYLFSLKNLSGVFKKYYGDRFENLPDGVTYTLTFKENDEGQLRLLVEPDSIATKATKKIQDRFFATPEELKAMSQPPLSPPEAITGFES